jgi:hypothetical protein
MSQTVMSTFMLVNSSESSQRTSPSFSQGIQPVSEKKSQIEEDPTNRINTVFDEVFHSMPPQKEWHCHHCGRMETLFKKLGPCGLQTLCYQCGETFQEQYNRSLEAIIKKQLDEKTTINFCMFYTERPMTFTQLISRVNKMENTLDCFKQHFSKASASSQRTFPHVVNQEQNTHTTFSNAQTKQRGFIFSCKGVVPKARTTKISPLATAKILSSVEYSDIVMAEKASRCVQRLSRQNPNTLRDPRSQWPK